MELFDETKDYKKLHIEWLKSKKGFRPRGGNPLPQLYSSYIDFLEAMYYHTDGAYKHNSTAYLNLRDDYMWATKSTTILDEVAIMFGDTPKNDNPSFFVTFNWADSNFNTSKILKGVDKLFSKSWIDNAEGVFEYYGLHDFHPHFHCVIQVNKHKTIGRFRDKIFESALASTLAKNFIDIKVARDYHLEYIDGDKKIEKSECLEKDKLWRIENNLAEKYKK